MSTSTQTHDHKQIKAWAEKHGAVPSRIKGTGKDSDEGLLRFHFPDKSKDDDQFEEMSWEDFFKDFDDNKLDLILQDKKADGSESTFHKFVKREGK